MAVRNLTAEELVALYQSSRAAFSSPEGLHHLLAQHGYDVVDVLRARHWLRRGRPADYVWSWQERDFHFNDHTPDFHDPAPDREA